MKPFLKKIAMISGVFSLVLPLLMGFLWFRYVKEQESLIGSESINHKPCEPYNMTTGQPADKLTISWQTRENCAGFVLLGESYAEFSNLPYKVLSAAGESPTKEHQITLLKQDELHYQYAIIVSDGEWYGINGNPFQYR